MQNYIKNNSKKTFIFLASLVVMSAVGLRYYNSASAEQQSAQEQQIMAVDVEVIKSEKLRVWDEFSGRLDAVDYVEIRPRVGGAITKTLFKEGEIVKKNDPLFVIDPRPYKAALASAEASLSSALSNLELANTELKRSKSLIAKNAISKSRHDSTINDKKVAQANLNSARAALTQAKLNYEYAHIKAPVSGRVSRAELTVGNIVEAGSNAPILTSIVSNDKLYAEFDVDEQTYVKLSRGRNSGEEMPVELVLASNDEVVYKGKLHSFDNKLDTTSGTIRARGIFDNDDGVLIPGMYAKVRLGSADLQEKILVDEKAIGTDQDKKFVYVIDQDSKVKYQLVELGGSANGKRIVYSGLSDGDKVIVNSLQKIRPNMQVKPKEESPAKEAKK